MAKGDPKPKEVEVFAPKKDAAPEKQGKQPELSLLTNWYGYAVEASRKKHWDFFVIDQYLRGNHNIRGNPNENTIEVAKRTDSVSYPINKVYSTFRAVRGYVTRHKPIVAVEVTDSTSDAAKDYARRGNKILERDNNLNNFRKINKDWVYYGVKYGLGWRQIGYDPIKKVSIRWSVDPFDLLVGSKTGKAEDAPYLIKTVVRTVDYWRSKYPKCNVVPDNEIAAAEYKRLSMQIQYQDTQSTAQNLEQQTAIGKECWYRVYKPNAKGGLINKVLFTTNEVVDFEETPFTEYPFIPYESEVTPNEVYPDGHIKHIIAPQRLLNLLNTQLLEYNHIVNRGRLLAEKNAGLQVIYAKEGQIIRHNAGKTVSVLNPPGINPALPRQIDLAQQWVEDIGGQHDASMGGTPSRVSSGDAIEALQVGDSNNIADLRDNFEDALAIEAAWILKMYSLFEKDGFVITDQINKEKTDQFGVVGQKALGGKIPEKYYSEDNGSYCDICAVLPDNQVRVSVTSQLGETRSARTKMLMDLVAVGMPLKVLLEHLEFPNTTDIMERIAEESLADIMAEKMKQPPMGGPGGPPVDGGGPPPPAGPPAEVPMPPPAQ